MKERSALAASMMQSEHDRFKVFKSDDVYDLPDDDTTLVPQDVASMVADRTRMEIEEFNNSSSILSMSAAHQRQKASADGATSNNTAVADIAPFHKHEIVLGDRLGRGCFSDIYAVKSFLPCPRYKRQTSAPTPSTCSSSSNSKSPCASNVTGLEVTREQEFGEQEDSETFEATERTRKMMALHTSQSSDPCLNQHKTLHHSNNISDNIKRAAAAASNTNNGIEMAISNHSRRSARSIDKSPNHSVASSSAGGASSGSIGGAVPEYVVKHLRPSLTSGDHETFETAAIDLGKEAQLLARIQHPNIIKLRGWAAYGTSGYATGRHDGYFLILDRLYETLAERITYWQKKANRFKMLLPTAKAERRALKVDRLKIGVDIASALTYLHEHNLMYRDLKPNNLGFDIHGNIQLFDFGLAKEMPDPNGGYQDTYDLSGCTGSMRYMAPEVARYEPYNLKADVYSFSILLYEVLALVKPFANFKPDCMTEKVFHENGIRPKLNPSSWPSGVINIVEECMCYDIALRPTMEEVHNVLDQEHLNMLATLTGYTPPPSYDDNSDGHQHQHAQGAGRHGRMGRNKRASLDFTSKMFLPDGTANATFSSSSPKRPSITSAALRNILPLKTNTRAVSVRNLYNPVSNSNNRFKNEGQQHPNKSNSRTARSKDLIRRESCQF
mmetsp:Transcript_21906/g.30502  ORF Transcript_21906/g.30502 Transcript_21906/m.30502 type:complete len:669 (+) Transcript_21906:88-2094(+)